MVKSPITVQTFFTDASPNGRIVTKMEFIPKLQPMETRSVKFKQNQEMNINYRIKSVDDEDNDPIEISDSDEVRNLQRKRKLQNEKVQLKKMKTISKRTIDR